MSDTPGAHPSVELSSLAPVVPDPRLMELLVCPVTKTTLHYDAARQELVSKAARLAFPIRSGVPLMSVESARHLDED